MCFDRRAALIAVQPVVARGGALPRLAFVAITCHERNVASRVPPPDLPPLDEVHRVTRSRGDRIGFHALDQRLHTPVASKSPDKLVAQVGDDR